STTDEGASWHRAPGEAGTATVYQLEEFPDGTLVAAAGYAGIYTSDDQGRTWSRNGSLPASYYSSLAVSPNGTLFTGGTGPLRRSTDRGATWSALPLNGDFLYASRAGMIFSRDSLGGLRRSADNGASWTPATGIEPQNTLYTMAEDSAGVLYAGAYEGVFTSADSGASWRKLLGQETWCLAVNAAGYLFRGDYGGAGLDGAGLSKNGGLSWRDLVSGLGGHEGITTFAILPSGRIFAGTVDGSVFRSATSSLPVVLSGLAGTPVAGAGVRVTWTTLEENSLLGFSVERSLAAAGPYRRLEGSYLPALGNTGRPNTYSYLDSSAVIGVPYYYRLRQIDGESDISFSRDCQVSTLNSVAESVPLQFALEQNYPNPFNPATVVRYSLPRAGTVQLEVFNTLGQRVAVLAAGPESAGAHEARFDGTHLASGMYIYRLSAGPLTAVRRMLLVK
ncbi:MAG TPA: T9SS type A sorting domain-containing protein, partial [Bacteroidota bacterium]